MPENVCFPSHDSDSNKPDFQSIKALHLVPEKHWTIFWQFTTQNIPQHHHIEICSDTGPEIFQKPKVTSSHSKLYFTDIVPELTLKV
jgi:hypothetical protein